MSRTLDLDGIAPVSDYIVVDEKKYEVKPLKVDELLEVFRLEESIKSAGTVDEIREKIKTVLGPAIPEMFSQDKIPVTLAQLKKIIAFVSSVNVPESATEAKEYDPKKKADSVKESPTSSDSTPAIEQ